jgi:GT2 family glycosyltransferase
LRVSVILPTSGRARSLAGTLPTVLAQNLPADAFEVIVVENGAAAGAARAVRKAARRHPGRSLRYVHDPTPGLLTGRHRGALEARGEILVFADDDVDASPGWLAAIVDAFADPTVHLVGGRNLPRYEAPPPSWVEGFWYTPPYGGRACVYLSLLDLGDAGLDIHANYVWGLNFSIRRATLFELGGFHPDNIPDHLQQFQGDGETGLTEKATARGLRAVYRPAALVHHRIPAARLTVGYFRRRAFYQGVCDSFTAIRREPSSLASAPPEDTAPARPARDAGIERGPLARLAARVQSRLRPAAAPTHAEVEAEFQAAYRAGYAFHQNTVRGNPQLLAWVLREEYWDYRLPQIARSPAGPDRAAAKERAASATEDS